MAKMHGVAGEWARVQGTIFGLWPLFLFVLLFGFALSELFVRPLLGALLALAALIGGGVCMNFGMRRVERFFKGARGEERVAGILKGLPDDFHVFNDFVACGKHIDHVLVCPTGVFAIETKFWRGKVTIEEGHILLDGQLPDRSPLAQVLREAKRLVTELKRRSWEGAVTPVLVFASDTFTANVAELDGAVVMNSIYLREGLKSDRVLLSPSELERLVTLMENR